MNSNLKKEAKKIERSKLLAQYWKINNFIAQKKNIMDELITFLTDCNIS